MGKRRHEKHICDHTSHCLLPRLVEINKRFLFAKANFPFGGFKLNWGGIYWFSSRAVFVGVIFCVTLVESPSMCVGSFTTSFMKIGARVIRVYTLISLNSLTELIWIYTSTLLFVHFSKHLYALFSKACSNQYIDL